MSIPLLYKEKVVGKIIDIPVDKIHPNKNQPRRFFDDEEISSLAQSISENGIIQPITVREDKTNYEIVAGERRFRAAIIVGYECIPCIILDVSDRESAVMALVENIQRKNLSCFDEAEAIRKMINGYGITQDEAAKKLGKNQSTIANKLRLLKINEEERKKISEYKLSERHARALLRIDETALRDSVIEVIHEKNLTVENTEKYIDRLLRNKEKEKAYKRRGNLFRHLSLFSNSINRAVTIMESAGVNCETNKIKGDGYVEFRVKISTDNLQE